MNADATKGQIRLNRAFRRKGRGASKANEHEIKANTHTMGRIKLTSGR